MNYYMIYVCEDDSVRLEPEVEIGGPNPFGEDWDTGRYIEGPDGLKFTTYLKKNRLYDWIGGYSWQPYVTQEVHDRLAPILRDTVQWIGPILCKKRPYYMLNCVNVIDCLLPNSTSNRLYFDDALLKNQLLFRPKGFPRILLATENLRNVLLSSRDSGIRLGAVQDDGMLTWFHEAEIVEKAGADLQ